MTHKPSAVAVDRSPDVVSELMDRAVGILDRRLPDGWACSLLLVGPPAATAPGSPCDLRVSGTIPNGILAQCLAVLLPHCEAKAAQERRAQLITGEATCG